MFSHTRGAEINNFFRKMPKHILETNIYLIQDYNMTLRTFY